MPFLADSDCISATKPAAVSTLQEILVNAALSCLAYGFFVCLAIIAGYIYLRNGITRNVPRQFIMAALVAFFLCCTVLCGTELAKAISSVVAEITGSEHASSISNDLFIVETVFSRIIYVLNEVIVVWRAWVITDRRLVRVILAGFMGLAIVCAIIDTAWDIKAGFFRVQPDHSYYALIMFLPLITTNFVATLVILRQAWIYRTQIKVNLPQHDRRNGIERILFLLVESGFIYCCFWVAFAVTYLCSSVPYMAQTVLNAVAPYTSAIYPLLIILVVEHQKSLNDSVGPSRPSRLFHSMRFASSHSTTRPGQIYSNGFPVETAHKSNRMQRDLEANSIPESDAVTLPAAIQGFKTNKDTNFSPEVYDLHAIVVTEKDN